MKKTILKKYANLIAQTGANVQKGQEVMIYADLDQPEFVKMLVEECYKLGAKKVMVEWDYQPLTKLNVKYRSLKTLSTIEKWEIERLEHRLKTLPVMIYLLSEDPDGLKGINQQKYSKSSQARYKITKPYRDKMDNKYQWCIAAVPGEKWAKKMFPNLRKSQAIEKLWEAILTTSRVDDNPTSAWENHNKDIKSRCDYLNSLGIKLLEYKSSNGTEFTVGLMENARFLGGREKTLSGVEYNPNIPSEEVFITPKKGEAQGIVYSSRPLSFRGELIENFSIRFENGKAVEVKAEKNEELLRELISTDEGASYLGECALVPYNSPICQSGLIFYNTLFDENAACHLAFGEGFAECIIDFDKYTLEQCREMGCNTSIIHEDFMIGTADLDITAVTRSGERFEIFKNGNWAF
ncbi:MAG: aminopeptidase [Acutalibacteraceae bacterium]|nr:aminopeptidase [Acutalibacteraceae bacterium]